VPAQIAVKHLFTK